MAAIINNAPPMSKYCTCPLARYNMIKNARYSSTAAPKSCCAINKIKATPHIASKGIR